MAGLKTGVGIPILSRGKVIAVLEFFMRESREQSERLLKVITAVAGQLDLLKRATRAEAAAREQQFLTLANSISQLAWMADGDGVFFGITIAGTIIPEQPSKKCKGGGGKKSIIPMKSSASWSDQGGIRHRPTLGGYLSASKQDRRIPMVPFPRASDH